MSPCFVIDLSQPGKVSLYVAIGVAAYSLASTV